MKCTFKLVYTSNVIHTTINQNILLNQLKKHINDKVLEKMSLHNNDYEILIGGIPFGETKNAIDLSSNLRFYTLKCNTFYIRPINNTPCLNTIDISNQECSICLQNFDSSNSHTWTSCIHHNNFCESCISNWSIMCNLNNRMLRCPICRQIISR